MDIVAAYQLVGSYRGAAEICDTTHKTVRRVIERTAVTAAGEQRPVRAPRPSNYEVVRALVTDAVSAGKGRVSATPSATPRKVSSLPGDSVGSIGRLCPQRAGKTSLNHGSRGEAGANLKSTPRNALRANRP